MIDNTTPHRQYPLPDADNLLSEDVGRLAQALGNIDADIHAAAIARELLSTGIGEAKQAAAQAQETGDNAQGRANLAAENAAGAQASADAAFAKGEAAQASADAAFAKGEAAQASADAAFAKGEAAQASADAALPKAGGTMTGHILTQYADTWVGKSFDNTAQNPEGIFMDYKRNGVIQGSQQVRLHPDGGSSFALQLTMPGNIAQERREDFFRADMSGLWHKAYGSLHDYFIDGDDLYHDWFPHHYAGAEVWWHKRLRLKICQMRIIAEPGRFGRAPAMTHTINLPTLFNGMATVLGWSFNVHANTPDAVFARLKTPSELLARGWGNINERSQAEFLIIGYANQ